MPGGFYRGNPLFDMVRGPARLLVEPITSRYPTQLADIIVLDTAGTSEVQTLTITGTPTSGTFTLTFNGQTTSAIQYNAASADVVAALEALDSIGAGGVTATGGPLPATPAVITFAGDNANTSQPLITATGSFTGGTTPTVTVARTTAGRGQYDPVGDWTELGMTRTGVSVERNDAQTSLSVDQIYGDIAEVPDSWSVTVTTAFAEVSLEHIQVAWETGAITTDMTPDIPERHLGIGNPQAFTQRRLAVLHQRTLGPQAGLIRAKVFRSVNRSATASALAYQQGGDQQTLPHVFSALADPNVADPDTRFGEIIDQISQ